jgi:hypothetical protein
MDHCPRWLVGGIQCSLILAVGVGTIVKFFRRKLDDIHESAEEMSARLADQTCAKNT